MRLNRKWILVIALVLSMATAISGTLAYLTDRDSEANVFVFGNVEIDLSETFEHGATLIPGVKIEKKPIITNTGKNDAWVWATIAIPSTLDNDDASANVLHFNYDNESVAAGKWNWKKDGQWNVEKNVSIENVNYNVYTILYETALTPGAATEPVMTQVYLDYHVDVDPEGNMYHVVNGEALDLNWNINNQSTPVMYVSAYAIQKDGFDTVQAAYEAYQGQWGDKGSEYAEPVDAVRLVGTLDELKDAFAKGGKVMLINDIQFEKMTPIEPGIEVYLNLNGKTITVDQNTTSNTLIYVKDGAKLVIDGNGTFDLKDVSTMAIFAPWGELVIENGTFKRNTVEVVTDDTTGLFMGSKGTSNVTINGGYFDPGYYNKDADDIEGILAGTKTFVETADDIAKRGNYQDANKVRTAIKENVSVLLNHSGWGPFKVYGGTFVGANPAWGDEGCMMPTTPTYLRPWSYYQGALLAGQTFNEYGIVIPAGYNIDRSVNEAGVPVYTVSYSE